MLQRIDYTAWHTLFPKIGFALFAFAFVVIVWRVFKMSRTETDAASKLPLQED